MPLYDYQCGECGHVDRFFDSMHTTRAPHYPCSKCNCIATRLLEPPQVSVFRAYRTARFDGRMQEVRTARQESDLCRRNNCTRLLSTDTFDTAKAAREREKRAKKILPSMEESYLQMKHEWGITKDTTIDDLPGSKKARVKVDMSTTA